MTSAPAERRRLRFHGRVQGVNFRATTQEFARRHSVTGWVRNLPDGTVEAELQSKPAAINAVLEELGRHFSGFIERREEDSAPLDDGESGFTIRY